MFEHSVKVPRNYKIAANIVKKVSTEGGSVKTLLYESKLRHFNINALFALLTKTIQHAAELDKVFALCSLFKNEPRLDPWLAKILATELLFGKKSLPGQSKPEKTINSYKEQFEKYISNRQDDKTQAVRRPRYVRINTNLLTTSDAIRAFQDEGYRFIRCTSGSYDDYLKQLQDLTEYDFTQDYHVKYLFVFAPGTRMHEHDLYLENKIILQDKATAMAVHLLAPPPGSVALDMCAAPGMKTTQLAAFMRNQGKIYAVERNEKRYQTLCEFVEKTGAKCVKTLHKDALELKRGDYDDVEYIILDPSCSGSGMELSVHNYIEDTRLAKLTSLQEKFLKHAMNAFPKAKRIVYSTCSLFPEENERVITNVVKTSRSKWRVQDVKELLKGQWNNFGSGMYGSMGARCMYAKPDTDLTIGFFLAVLDRDQKDFEKSQNSVNGSKEKTEEVEQENEAEGYKKKNKIRQEVSEDVVEAENFEKNKEVEQEGVAEAEGYKKKKKKNKIRQEVSEDVAEAEDFEKKKNNEERQEVLKDNINVETEIPKKKKKKNILIIGDFNHLQEDVSSAAKSKEVISKKKKKKDKHRADETEIEIVLNESEVPSVQDDATSENAKKKNKRKHKTSDALSVEEEQPAEVVTPVKKKKKKHKDVTIEFEDVHDEQTESTTKLKKKKRNKGVETS